MRRILVDAARARGAHKRGGSVLKVNLDESALLSSIPSRSILALHEALTAFSQVAPRQAKVVELRYFGGLTEEEIVAFHVSPPLPRNSAETGATSQWTQPEDVVQDAEALTSVPQPIRGFDVNLINHRAVRQRQPWRGWMNCLPSMPRLAAKH